MRFLSTALLGVVAAIALSLAGCQLAQPGAPAAASRASWPDKVRFASGPQGGSFFAFSSVWANVLRSTLNLNASVEVTQAGSANIFLLEDKKTELSLVAGTVGVEAWTGTGWTKGTKHQDAWRAIVVTESGGLQFWTLADRGIQIITDMNGKRVNLSAAGSAADLVGRRVFELLEIKPARITNVSHSAANQQMIDGLVDASLTAGGFPQPAITELASTRDVRIVEIPAQFVPKLTSAFPAYVAGEVPAGTYRGQSKGVPIIVEWFYAIVRSDLPNDFVYEVTKATLAGQAQMAAGYKPAQQMAAENVQFLKVPLHCGAFKYYQEKGVAVPKEAQPVDKC